MHCSVLSIPGNLTVIVQPGFYPLLEGGMCGNPGIEYGEMIEVLARASRVHVRLPEKEDYHPGRGLVLLRRAIEEFEDRTREGEGDWALPGPLPDPNEWW